MWWEEESDYNNVRRDSRPGKVEGRDDRVGSA